MGYLESSQMWHSADRYWSSIRATFYMCATIVGTISADKRRDQFSRDCLYLYLCNPKLLVNWLALVSTVSMIYNGSTTSGTWVID